MIKENYDVEIGFLEGICTKIISAAGKNTKKIGWIHTNIEKIPRRHREFVSIASAGKCYNLLDDVICVSKEAGYSYLKMIKPDKEATVIYNPIDVDSIISKSKKKTNSVKKEKFTICAIGRFVYPKGFERLIDSAIKLIKEGNAFELWIIGEGALYGALQKKISDNHMNSYIKLIGFKENVYPYLANSDLYICSSRYEGYSLTVAEALVLGVPVISTRCTGPIELLDHGKYGLLVENSGQGIYNGLKAVMENKELLIELKEKSQIRGRQFNVESSISHIKEVIG